MRIVWIIMGLSLLASTAAQAEVYRWVDKNGVVHYADNPPLDANAQARRLGNNQIEGDKYSYATREAAKNAPVVLYVAPECKELCATARQLLTKRKVPFTEKDASNEEVAQGLKKLMGAQEMRVPTMTVGTKASVGFEAGAWNAALDVAGYPK